MRILAVSLTFPFPATNGHKLRNWAILRALAAENHAISLLTFAEPTELHGDIAPLCGVVDELRVVPLQAAGLSEGRNYAGRARSLLGTAPYAISRFSSREMAEQISKRLATGKYNAVLAETSYALENVPSSLNVPLILDNHNIEHRLLDRYVGIERSLARRTYARIESRKLKAWEQSAWERANLTWACSDHDRSVIQELAPGAHCAVVPNVVDVVSRPTNIESEPFKILFTGGMDWHPNRDAVEFFATEILPEVRKNHPEAKFVVAGRSPTEGFRSRFAKIQGMSFTGTVEDMKKEFANSSMCVVPLRIGSGTRLKILEAASMAKPVISTRIGAEGLDFENGKEIVLADEPSVFTRAISDLLRDAPLREALGAAARRKVEQSYSLASLRAALRDALSGFPGAQTSPSPEPQIEWAALGVRQ